MLELEKEGTGGQRARRQGGLASWSSRQKGRTNEHGDNVSKPTAERKPKKITPEYLSNAALYYLQRFAASRARLQDVLLRKVARRLMLKTPAAEEVREWLPEIQKLLDRYEESGLINDIALAEARVAGMRRSGGSAHGIMQKLRQKGLAVSIVESALESYSEAEGVDDAVALQQFMKKKKFGPFRAANVLADEKRIKKEIGSLLRAGFNYQLVKVAMKAEEIMPPE